MRFPKLTLITVVTPIMSVSTSIFSRSHCFKLNSIESLCNTHSSDLLSFYSLITRGILWVELASKGLVFAYFLEQTVCSVLSGTKTAVGVLRIGNASFLWTYFCGMFNNSDFKSLSRSRRKKCSEQVRVLSWN